MKTIPVEKLDHRVGEALRHHKQDEPVLLTENSRAVGLLVRLPEGLEATGFDAVVWLEGSTGRVFHLIEAKWPSSTGEPTPKRPSFGSGRGMLTVVAEDDDHLKDFDEYMR